MPITEELIIIINMLPNFELMDDTLILGSVKIKVKTGIYYVNGHQDNAQTVESWKVLPRSDLYILLLLIRKLDSVATKDEILDTGWKNKMVSESSICVSIYNIRQLLKLAGINSQFMLKNFSGVGYGLFKINSNDTK